MFFTTSEDKSNLNNLIKVSALMIHAAKIDENYSDQEEKIIKLALLEIGANKNDLENIIEEGKKIETN